LDPEHANVFSDFGQHRPGPFDWFVWEWLREHKHRVAANSNGKQVSKLERELAAMRDATSLPKDDILALLDGPKAR
jgi:hypothetical protein